MKQPTVTLTGEEATLLLKKLEYTFKKKALAESGKAFKDMSPGAQLFEKIATCANAYEENT